MNNIDFNKKYYIHPAYIIKPDKTRAITSNSKGYETIPYPKDDVNTSFSWIMHPIYALMFSFFDGSKTLSETIESISSETGMDTEKVKGMVVPYINNPESQIIRYMKTGEDKDSLFPCNSFPIPKFFIVECSGKSRTDLYPKESFYIKKDLWNFDTYRLSSPTGITLMLNNTCVTNCTYCYANKKHKVANPLSTKKILSLIEEADKMGVLDFNLSGGEVLLHPDYDIILSELYKHGFIDHISTKVCLTEKQILKLKEIGINQIQVSVDAWDADILQKILHVKRDYFDNLKKSLSLLEKHEINVSIKSVITNINSSIESVDNLLDNLLQYKNIKYISVAPGEYSLYKPFDDYKITAEEWNKVREFVEQYGKNYRACDIRSQGILLKSELVNHVHHKDEAFRNRGVCSGNVMSLYILPDGQVTICEELYWHPKFIVGDVNKQSIQEIWDSKEATDLYNLLQQDFHKNSACKYCPHFKICRLRQGVCWKMIFQAYGMDDWQLPDPRCPLAPPPVNECYR
jgi:radical SAM protein with 4Fe4S-binding SPASM domain